MRKYSVQIAVLIVCAINLCSAADKKEEKKQCPPRGFPKSDYDSPEDYAGLADNWKIQKCAANMYCREIDCLEITYGINDKGVVFHSSAVNKSSSKVLVVQSILKRHEEGELILEMAPQANCRFFYIVREEYYFLFTCFDDHSSGVYLATKGDKLEMGVEKEAKELVKKCGLKWEDLISVTRDKCAKKLSLT